MPEPNPEPTPKRTAYQPNIAALQQKLIRQLKRYGALTSPSIEAAFQSVPRHLFVPNVPLAEVYEDRAIALKEEGGQWLSSSSQPAMMAIMLEQLALKPGMRVLEIGAGSGYNAALMAQIVGETGHVVTVDIDEEMVAAARQHLDEAGFGRVQTICGDGGHGYAEGAPYDRIILTVGAADILLAWLQQLKPDGWLLLPFEVVSAQQGSVLFERVQDQSGDHLVSRSIHGTSFIRLRGEFTVIRPQTAQTLGPEPGLFLYANDEAALPVALELVYSWLTGAYLDFATGVSVTEDELFYRLSWWLALNSSGQNLVAPGLPEGTVGCGLVAEAEIVARNVVPALSEVGRGSGTMYSGGLMNKNGMAFLMRSPNLPPATEDAPSADHHPPFELYVRQYGSPGNADIPVGTPLPTGMSAFPGDTHLAQFLVNQIQRWQQAGRPTLETLHIRVYPIDAQYTPQPGEFVVKKKWSQLVITL